MLHLKKKPFLYSFFFIENKDLFIIDVNYRNEQRLKYTFLCLNDVKRTNQRESILIGSATAETYSIGSQQWGNNSDYWSELLSPKTNRKVPDEKAEKDMFGIFLINLMRFC